jgi:ADP-ribosylglycohydrolase
MLGAIAGDIIGSVYEWDNIKTTEFPLFQKHSRFTDDSVLSVAVADSILNDKSFAEKYKHYYALYPTAGFGGRFTHWASSDSCEPYNSFGNGSAMRVAPIGFACNQWEKVLLLAQESAMATHNHPEGIKGAQAVAGAIFLARQGENKRSIKKIIQKNFHYDLNQSLDKIRPHYKFDVTCQGSVPQAICAFLESENFEDAIRKAVSIGGDSDTIACISGGIAQAFYGEVPPAISKQAFAILDERLRKVVQTFNQTFSLK